MEMSTSLAEIFIDDATTAGGATNGPLPSSQGWDIYDLWGYRMDSFTASSILHGNATVNGTITNQSNSTSLFNATETSYADGAKNEDAAIMGLRIGSVPPMGSIGALVPRHGIALYRLRAQGGGSKRKRDEL